jgi:hypothetical protein
MSRVCITRSPTSREEQTLMVFWGQGARKDIWTQEERNIERLGKRA